MNHLKFLIIISLSLYFTATLKGDNQQDINYKDLYIQTNNAAAQWKKRAEELQEQVNWLKEEKQNRDKQLAEISKKYSDAMKTMQGMAAECTAAYNYNRGYSTSLNPAPTPTYSGGDNRVVRQTFVLDVNQYTDLSRKGGPEGHMTYLGGDSNIIRIRIGDWRHGEVKTFNVVHGVEDGKTNLTPVYFKDGCQVYYVCPIDNDPSKQGVFIAEFRGYAVDKIPIQQLEDDIPEHRPHYWYNSKSGF